MDYGNDGLTGVVWNIDTEIDLSKVAADTYAWVDDEALAVTAIDEVAGTVTVDRGILDTVPTPHAANAGIWFADTHLGIDDDRHQGGETVDIKCLPTTTLGTLDISVAATLQKGMNWRYYRPYPPGNVKINTVAYPTVIEGGLTVFWSHRDRNLQLDYLHTQSEGAIGPEVGTTYNLRIYGELDTLVHTETGITGTSYTYPLVLEKQEGGLEGEGEIADYYDTMINADSPTLYFRLGDSAGPTANDETTNHDGTYIGSPTLGETGMLLEDTDTCVLLSGSGQYISVPNHADFATQKCAASCVINPDSLSGDVGLFHFGDASSGGNIGYFWKM